MKERKKAQPWIEVLQPGLFTTVQDLGRTGFQEYGMVVAGAMDAFALQVANLLVGNRRDEAALEITLAGPKLRLLSDALMAICGADLSPTLDGEPAPLWKSFWARAGQILTFGAPRQGARAYLAVQGGIDLPAVMGSKATYVRGRLGGYKGRPIAKGDQLRFTLFSLGKATGSSDRHALAGRGLRPEDIPRYPAEATIRVILGPDLDAFEEESVDILLSQPYQITSQADRMGYRLSGPKLRHRSSADIYSSAVTMGTIQVPAGGEPIILMADRQTTGGYARIAHVISIDLSQVAQMVPGDTIRFKAVTVEEAQRLYRERERFLRHLSLACQVRGSTRPFSK